ncbi:glycosyltransferase [Aidingimonas halophila]|uniref:Glycosyltransferase involved in cell wall bisynthesis n=1 Tax=Aidingimonas halophila TaxID=574349 RepID=A0A1H3CFN2_9GAMM|nr:glycosyltransferase [Aidingimonas halophila]GHC35537.1 hypothetical protein GCM10008094_30940 [Aidingimonas halophila]SDX52951.1 Glycosyltransferase involved in cell wall bisynthesis [Aidingimonas halophila]
MNYLFVAFVDKGWPPSHSFVDGMLASVLADSKNVRVRIYVSNSAGGSGRPRRYLGAVCIPSLFPREGLKRLVNFFKVIFILHRTARKKNSHESLVVFVRNDPIVLLASSVFYKKCKSLIYQSSFPHEKFSGSVVKRFFSKYLLLLSRNRVSSILAVSPDGLLRMYETFPPNLKSSYIPLLCDFTLCESQYDDNVKNKIDNVRFIYSGTFGSDRKLEIVIEAVVKYLSDRLDADFLFIGGDEDDVRRLKQVPGVQQFVKKGNLKIECKVSRSELVEHLLCSDIGLCLIPPTEEYMESSPTKLSEYMGAGLAVLASYGIPLQEKFIKESEAGLLVNWSVEEMVEGIGCMVKEVDNINLMKVNAKAYADKKLKYNLYKDNLLSLFE